MEKKSKILQDSMSLLFISALLILDFIWFLSDFVLLGNPVYMVVGIIGLALICWPLSLLMNRWIGRLNLKGRWPCMMVWLCCATLFNIFLSLSYQQFINYLFWIPSAMTFMGGVIAFVLVSWPVSILLARWSVRWFLNPTKIMRVLLLFMATLMTLNFMAYFSTIIRQTAFWPWHHSLYGKPSLLRQLAW